MTLTFRAHFDGKVLVPDEPVQIPVDQPVHVQLVLAPTSVPAVSAEERRAAIDRLISRPIKGLNIPDAALTREGLYSDEI